MDQADQIVSLIKDFAAERLQFSVGEGSIDPTLDRSAYTVGYATAIFDVITHVLAPKFAPEHVRDARFVFLATTMSVLKAIEAGFVAKISPVLEDQWKVPES